MALLHISPVVFVYSFAGIKYISNKNWLYRFWHMQCIL